jgi:hypothetical protein
VVLATGEVVIESLDTAYGELVLLNLGAHAVSLQGWTLFSPATGLWCDLPRWVLLPGSRLRVVCGRAAVESGLPAGVVLYDPEGTIKSTK